MTKCQNTSALISVDLTHYERVFEHNYTSTSRCWNNEAEVLRSNQPNKFSIFDELSHPRFNIDGRYHYFLLYPNEGSNVAWSQSYPIIQEKEKVGQSPVRGFSKKFSTVTNAFTGLCVQTIKDENKFQTFIEGNCAINDPNWYYSLGMFCENNWESTNIGFPGPDIGVKRVILYAEAEPLLDERCFQSCQFSDIMNALSKCLLVFNTAS